MRGTTPHYKLPSRPWTCRTTLNKKNSLEIWKCRSFCLSRQLYSRGDGPTKTSSHIELTSFKTIRRMRSLFRKTLLLGLCVILRRPDESPTGKGLTFGTETLRFARLHELFHQPRYLLAECLGTFVPARTKWKEEHNGEN